MVLPLQITFRNLHSSEMVKGWIQEEANKLNEFYGKITSCRVVVELPNRRHKAGNLYHVRIDLTVPGGEMVVERQPGLRGLPGHIEIKPTKSLEVMAPHKDLRQAINDAFGAMQRRLQNYSRRRRHDVKVHNAPPTGRVIRLFPQGGYGFLEAVDGREIYFHKNSVLNDAFALLAIGSAVSFIEEKGDEGPQASNVKLVRRRTMPGERGSQIAA
ncbi:MAG: HPF/RaiA family ribosome-associated protein [Acidobacteria bacterium]|nr:MAG: HPF/RaiA family ribosome-associated protein [Acidobacteriota bacterium]